MSKSPRWTTAQLNKAKGIKPTPKIKTPKPRSKGSIDLEYLLKEAGVNYVREHEFHTERMWRFDFALPELKIALEFEGIVSEKSRHTTLTGYTEDCEKYNAAACLGWIVLRYTALNVGNATQELKAALKYRRNNL